MDGYSFIKGPWQNVPWLISNTRQYYDEKVIPKGGPNMHAAAIPRILEARKWTPSHRLYRDYFEDILRELGIFYVPKTLQPGPAVVFPMRDVRGKFTLASLKPLYELIISETLTRYAYLGNSKDTIGPRWLGMTRETTERILRQRCVNLVEGPFDYLACRLLAPDVPTLSTGTKNFNDMHIAHLRLLGVKRLYLFFDKGDEGKHGYYEGAGGMAAKSLQDKWMAKLSEEIDIKRVYQRGGAGDPANCLQRMDWAQGLKEMLQNMRGI